ncbi:hypothetical protein [Solidesulfovibrio sp.]
MTASRQPAQGTVVALFERSYGEVDWILPALVRLRALRPGWRLIAAFSPAWKRFNPIGTNRTLDALLAATVDQRLHVGEGERLFPAAGHPDDVRLIVKDKGEDGPFRQAVLTACPGAKVICFPHGVGVRVAQNFNHPRNFNAWGDHAVRHDAVLIQTPGEAVYVHRQLRDARLATVGIPTHDPWWIEKLLRAPELSHSPEAAFAASAREVFLFIPRGPERVFPKAACDYIHQSVIETTLARPGSVLLVKPHPRQDVGALAAYLAPYDPARWRLTSLHPMQLMGLSDLVISTWSGCVLDAAAMDKPCLEFHRYETPTGDIVIDHDGRMQSTARLLGLAVPVDTREELVRRIDACFANADAAVWQARQQAFETVFPRRGHSADAVARLAVALVEGDDSLPDAPAVGDACAPRRASPSKSLLPLLRISDVAGQGACLSEPWLRALRDHFRLTDLVWTGSFDEELCARAGSIFDRVHGIELAADLYQAAKRPGAAGTLTSADVLALRLPSLGGPALFCLGSHETAAQTMVTRTNTPVLEELRTLAGHGPDRVVALVRGLRHFGPVRPGPFERSAGRDYPEAARLGQVVAGFAVPHELWVLGDAALVCPAGSGLAASPGVRALTLSRLAGATDDMAAVIAAEESLGALPADEAGVLRQLPGDVASCEEAGCGGHLHLWRGLVGLGRGRADQAREDFSRAGKAGFDHWRLQYHEARAALACGDAATALALASQAAKAAPDPAPVLRLLAAVRDAARQRRG